MGLNQKHNHATAYLAIAVALSICFLYTDTRTIPGDVWTLTGRVSAPATARNTTHTTSPPRTVPGEEALRTNAEAPPDMAVSHSDNPSVVLGTVPPGNAASAATIAPPRKVLCISGRRFGRTSNQLIETAAALKMASADNDNGTTTTIVGFSPEFSVFYDKFLDPRDDILLNYAGPCVSVYTPKELFYAFAHPELERELRALVPKAVFRAEAEAVLASYPPPVTTVHRRHLEGKCIAIAKRLVPIHCPNLRVVEELGVPDFIDACNMKYSMIANETRGTTVVLLTDGQVPKLDRTFPHISHHSFPVQAWMMARSAFHYGNPLSTVDYVVYYWRGGGTEADTARPRECYKT